MEEFIGSIETFAFSAIPDGWAACQGQIIPIQKLQSLYALIGHAYGGDGVTTFALPDLRGRTPVGAFQNSVPLSKGITPRKMGEKGGEAYHLLTAQEMPEHSHSLSVCKTLSDLHTPINGSSMAAPSRIAGRGLGATFGYSPEPGTALMGNESIARVGGTPHINMQPFLGLQYCICIVGTYPQRN